jgi:hypothetical protein
MRIIIILLIALIMTTTAHALGITPAAMEHDYAEGKAATGKFKVIATTNTYIDVSGELKDYIDLSRHIIGKGEHIIEYTVRMPSTITPGMHTAYITAMETSSSSSVVSATAKVTATITLYKPVGEEYATLTIYPPRDNSNSFIYKVENKGLSALEESQLILNIREGNRNIMTLEAMVGRLMPGESATGTMAATGELPDGKYTYSATLAYGSSTATSRAEFTHGTPKILYLGVRAPQFILGAINEFIITLENPFNTPIFYKLVFNMIQGGSSIDTYEKTDTISERTEQEVSAFINTQEASVGNAKVTTTLDYEGKRAIYEESIELSHSSATIAGRVITQQGGSSTLIMLIIIAIIINSIFIVIIYKSVKKK